MSLSRRYIPRCLDAIKTHKFLVPQSRPFSISVPRRTNTLMETSGFSETQLDVREAIAKICSNFPDVRWDSSIWWTVTKCMPSGLLGSTWWVRRIPSWVTCCSGERWLDWDCSPRRFRRSWLRHLRGNHDATYDCGVSFWSKHRINCFTRSLSLKRSWTI